MSAARWFGAVPGRWDVFPGRALFREVDERNCPHEELLSVTIGRGVARQRELLADRSKKDSSNEDKSAYKLVQPGDLVYNKMRAWQGAVGVSPYRGIVSPAYIVQRPRMLANARFFHYLLRTPAFAKEAERWSYGITSDQWSLRAEHFKMIWFPVPSNDEQEAIVRLLDHADRQIRRAIRAKLKLIALLAEQKQAVIRRAVTRGFDVDVRLKSSGVDWIGDVPEHWDVLALKHVLRRLIDCEHKTAPAVPSSEYRVIRTTAVRHGRLRLEGMYCTSAEAFAEWTRRGVPEANDVIFTREAPAGEACVVPPHLSVCLGQRTVLMKVKERYDPRFLVHMIYGGPPSHRIKLASQGATVGHFNMDDIAALTVLAPPFAEQQWIVARIADETRAIEQGEDAASREIDLLREYRTRLVSDVVTGNLDVREAAARLPADIDEEAAADEIDVEEADESDELEAVEA